MNKKKKVAVAAGSPAINIGVSEEGIAATRGAIMDILNCEKAGDEAKVAALDTLKTLCQVSNVTVRECNFEMK